MCIRDSVCPVYRQVGGCAYGSVYSGPIGAVLTPLLQPETLYELSNASSLCGACAEACPVRIPLHDMLVRLRRRNVEAGRAALPPRGRDHVQARPALVVEADVAAHQPARANSDPEAVTIPSAANRVAQSHAAKPIRTMSGMGRQA